MTKESKLHESIYSIKQIYNERRYKEFSVWKNIRRIEELQDRTDMPKPFVYRKYDGDKERMDEYFRREKIKALGNAVVPACAEKAAEMILEIDKVGELDESFM